LKDFENIYLGKIFVFINMNFFTIKNLILSLMKKSIIFLIAATLFLSACVSSRKHIQKGHYDEAIRICVKKLHKNPNKAKHIENLDRAYKYAMQKDNERITFLKKSGQPDIWEEVFLIYEKMKIRQEKVRVLPMNILNTIGFKHQDFDADIIEAKKKAADYLYTNSVMLLETKDKTNARIAYEQLLRVKSYFSVYRDVDSYLQKALNLGTTFIIFSMKNNTGVPLPPSFETELQKISLADLNSKWLRYETVKVAGRDYDYVILLNIRIIDVSPDALKEVHFAETKEVDDGFKYVLDANGNVMKDSLGNDIKIPITKIISCNVIETQQNKSVLITGTLDFINLNTQQVIKTDPITSQFFFQHTSATANGNFDALKPETKEKLKIRPMPFPNDFEMILNAGDIIKDVARNIIRQNRHIIY